MPTAEPIAMMEACSNCSRIVNTQAMNLAWNSSNYRICDHCFNLYIQTCVTCGARCAYDPLSLINVSMGLSEYAYAYQADDTSETICNDCSYMCSNCDCVYQYEDNYNECCEERHRTSSVVHDYGYRPAYEFLSVIPGTQTIRRTMRPGRYKLYMGFEIELANARNLMGEFYDKSYESFENPRFIYAKLDASIGTNGVEFVTMPATLDAFNMTFPWETFKYMHSMGARGWAYESCGMHIHVSRTAFTPSHLYKFMKFHSMNDSLCIEFAGRNSGFARWDNDSMEQIRHNTKEYLGAGSYAERYSAINVLPRSTIELRYFRSNINKNGILRNAQWVDAIYEYTKQMNITVPRLNRWNYEPFLEFMEQKPKYSLALEQVRKVWS